MDQRPVPGPEQPRVEPEIIPPGEAGARSRWGESWTAFDDRGTQGVLVARLGPFGFAMLLLAIVAVAAVILLLVLGAFVILLPLAGLLLAAALVTSLWRGSFRRP